jgi:hypothetical protein
VLHDIVLVCACAKRNEQKSDEETEMLHI